MSTADEVLQLLDGSVDEVVERVAGIRDHSTLIVMHLAERRGRLRRKVLEVLEARGLELEAGSLPLQVGKVEREVAELIATLSFSRPSAQPLNDALDGEDRYPVPREIDFVDPRTGREWDFMAAPDLEEIGNRLIAEYDVPLREAGAWKVTYLWRKDGTVTNRVMKLATTSKASGASGFFAGTDFLVVVAADFLRGLGIKRYQLNPLIFHELKHITSSDFGPALVGHDAEIFFDELTYFGAWREDLELLRGAVLQMPLPGMTGP